jgi:hypothetical protein
VEVVSHLEIDIGRNISGHNLLSHLRPGRPLEAGRAIGVNQHIGIAGFFHDVASFHLHALDKGLKKLLRFGLERSSESLDGGISEDVSNE